MRPALWIHGGRGLMIFGLLAAVMAARGDTIRTKDGQSFDGRLVSQTDARIRRTLLALERKTSRLEVLGSYPVTVLVE